MGPSVETSHGRISGSDVRGISTFKGIPYAKPPTGLRRFQPPEPPDSWAGTRAATRPGPVPVQAGIPFLRFLNAGGARQSEDCLYLNVFTPGAGQAKRPVLVWIHGGGFLVGAGSTPIYEGNLLARHGDLVVVTLNYRLGALGYLHLNGVSGAGFEQASNAGVRDQIAALEWVRDNIERFGGDPSNVTVCGQSAGAMSIGALLGSPRARQLLKRVVLQSGAAQHVLPQERANQVAEVFLHALGNPPRNLEELAGLPVERILRAQGATNRKLADLVDLMVLLPCVDGELITESPLDAVRRGATADIQMLIGTTLDEWKLFTPLDSGLPTMTEDTLVSRFDEMLAQVASAPVEALLAAGQYREAVRARGGRTTAFEIWSAFQSSRIFHFPASQLAASQADAGADVFSYLFSWHPPAMRGALGAFHAIELPFVFGLTSHPVMRPFTGLAGSAGRLSSRMQEAWISFARGGHPGHEGLPEWDAYDSQARATMVFDRECSIRDGPLEGERKLLSAWV